MNKNYIFLIAISVPVAVFLTACAQPNVAQQPAVPQSTSQQPTTQQPVIQKENGSTNTITINNFNFNPSQLSISKGSTVTWTNQDPIAHTVTAKDSFDSKILNNGQSFSYTFNQSGSFDFACTIHPSMKGTITVN